MNYSRVNWQDGNAGGTPLDAYELNIMDQGIADEDITNPSSPAAVALAKQYAPIGAAELGPRFLFLGDSITAGSVTSDQSSWGGGFTVQAALQSKGQIIQTRNAGVAGNKAADMLARFSTDVTPYASQIDTVFLLAGTNDSATTAFSSWVSSMKSLISNIRALGKAPVMATIPPNNGAAPRPAAITQQNAWIRRYATQQRIPLVDFYKVLVDPTTGNYLSGYSSDGTHPTPQAQVVMATAMVNALSPLLPPASIVMPLDNNDPNNLLTNGCFVNWSTPMTVPTVTAAATGTGGTLAAGTYYYKVTALNYQGESLPSTEVSVAITAGQNAQLTISNPGQQRVLNIYRSTSPGNEVLIAANVSPASYPTSTVWTDTGSGTPGTQTPPTQDYTTSPTGWGPGGVGPAQLTKLTDPAFQGFAGRYASNGNLGTQNQAVSSGFSPGDTLAIVAVMRTAGGNAPGITVNFNGGASPNKYSVSGAGTAAWGPGVYYDEVVVPAGTTSITFNIQNSSSGTGTVDFGQLGLYNLTALGVL